ncbi:50S ribosomal protein L9 [Longimicrobium terrae]|uniref:Large ribosomal subunit protein bL9 n=1 Tax=Longimicrobium terrae TaxID=1639882 RepID=A0A841GXF0_9BACT|nr:50S ribosomal protein L9 [Longimicrobium terrae]MBB4635791.1 large subunit ribosomal protein L9 [Longimicrobium terrae]MBB6070186.1 large subunit ribosomal protein L9 [Longimicrobium terrae]NNC30691.1 50S ribosomal protein L9 [Longimicrobium terrae]
MQVILRERIEGLGAAGDVVDVKPGYGRNYLVPRGLAYEATQANVRRIDAERAAQTRRDTETLDSARQAASAIEGVSLTFHARAGQEGKLFGSITSADIAEKLAEQGVQIDRRTIELEEPIKALGVTSVPVRLHPQVRPEIKVWVIASED